MPIEDAANYFDSKNWHVAANLFPMLAPHDLKELAEDIGQKGLLNPIVLHEGRVLDGRNRLLACREAGVEPVFMEWKSTGISPLAWVMSLNLKRRHLSKSQLAMIAEDARPLMEAEAKKRQSEAGNPLGKAKSASVKNDKSTSEKPIDARREVAKVFNVSQGYVHAAQKIKRADPKVAERVKAGHISISDAEEELGFNQNAVDAKAAQRKKERTKKHARDIRREIAANEKAAMKECIAKMTPEEIKEAEEKDRKFREELAESDRKREEQRLLDETRKLLRIKISVDGLKEAQEIVAAGKKARAQIKHPDKEGGSTEGMQLVNEAAQWLIRNIKNMSNGERHLWGY